MMQGDSYGVVIKIVDASGSVVTDATVSDLEIKIGHLRKTYKKGEVVYDSVMLRWIVPLTQEETFSLPAMRVKGQMRVAWIGGGVEGASLGYVDITESTSKEVLE